MFKFIIAVLVALISSSSAFAPAGNRGLTPRLVMKDMVGASVEVNGGKIYDPLDTLTLHNVAPSVFPHAKWMREAELKHCRAAMLATVGLWSPAGLPIPGYTPATSGGPVENLNKFALEQPLALAQIILAIGIIEGHFFPGEMWFGGGDRDAGDLGYDPLGLFKKKTDAQKDEMRLKELKNGRLAMIAMAAYTSEHWIPGSVPISFSSFGLTEQ